MPELKVIQYMRPNGRRVEQLAPVDEETHQKGTKILEAGLELAAEHLITGQIALYITDNKAEIDLVCRICTNDSSVKKTMKEMIMGFNLDEYLRGKTDSSQEHTQDPDPDDDPDPDYMYHI